MRLGIWIGIGLFAIAGVGCGGGGSKAASYADISNSFAHPTGTLAATNADTVAKAYQASLSAGTGPAGRRLDQKLSAVTQSVACPAGGTYSINVGQATSAAVSASFTYTNCCETAGCCYSGPGNVFYSTTGNTLSSFCESFQLSGTCSGLPIAENFSFCEDGTTGMLSYLVEVDGDSFAVSGNYSNGTGMLTISGKNGTFSCTYTNDTGSCTGTSGTFTF